MCTTRFYNNLQQVVLKIERLSSCVLLIVVVAVFVVFCVCVMYSFFRPSSRISVLCIRLSTLKEFCMRYRTFFNTLFFTLRWSVDFGIHRSTFVMCFRLRHMVPYTRMLSILLLKIWVITDKDTRTDF